MEQIVASLASLVRPPPPPPPSSREQIVMEKPREEKERELGEVRRKPLERTVEVKGGGWILILGGLLVASAAAAIVARRAQSKRSANEKGEGLDGDEIQGKGDIDRSISVQEDDSVKPKESFLDDEELPICSKPVMNHLSDKFLRQRDLALHNEIGEKDISSTDQCGNYEPQEQVQQILENSESVLVDDTKEEDDDEEEPILVDYHMDVVRNQRVSVLEKTEFVYVGKVGKVEVMSVLKSELEMSQQQFEELLDAHEIALIHGEKDDQEDSEHGMNHHRQTELVVQRLIPALGNEDKEDETSPRKHKLMQMRKCDTINMANKNVGAIMVERDEEDLVFAGKSSPREFEFEMAESKPNVSGELEPFAAKVMDEQQEEAAPQGVLEETNSQLQINQEQTEQFLDECNHKNVEEILLAESESEINRRQTDQILEERTDQILEESELSSVNEQKESSESQIQMIESNSEMLTESECLSLNEDGGEEVKPSTTELQEETTSQVEMSQPQNEQHSNDAKLEKEEIEEKNIATCIEGRKKITENMMAEKLMTIREKAVILEKFLMDIPERLLVALLVMALTLVLLSFLNSDGSQ